MEACVACTLLPNGLQQAFLKCGSSIAPRCKAIRQIHLRDLLEVIKPWGPLCPSKRSKSITSVFASVVRTRHVPWGALSPGGTQDPENVHNAFGAKSDSRRKAGEDRRTRAREANGDNPFRPSIQAGGVGFRFGVTAEYLRQLRRA